MSRFTDKLGREWALDVTMGGAQQVEQDTGIDLLKWMESPDGADNRTVFRIVGSLCAEQVADKGLSARQFADGFDGPALERAGQALTEALLFFSLPQKAAVAATGKLRTVYEAQIGKAVSLIESSDFRS